MFNKQEALKYLTRLTEPILTDQQLADKLGIHRVSWLRIKSGRAPVSDKFMLRIDRAFPDLDIFLPGDATNHGKDATQNTHQAHQNQNPGGFSGKVRRLFKGLWKC